MGLAYPWATVQRVSGSASGKDRGTGRGSRIDSVPEREKHTSSSIERPEGSRMRRSFVGVAVAVLVCLVGGNGFS
jgi:hypothetical protein